MRRTALVLVLLVAAVGVAAIGCGGEVPELRYRLPDRRP